MLDNSQVESIKQKSSALIERLTSAKTGQPKIPGVVFGFTDENQTLVFNYDGVTDLEEKTPVKKDTMFAFYSCTKAMTALAALKLIEEGKLALNDLAAKYVPEIDDLGIVDPGTVDKETGEFLKPPRKPKTRITIRHLMTHTSSLAYFFLNEECALLTFKKNPQVLPFNPTEEFFGVNKTPLIGEPGEKFVYGYSYDWLGLIIQQITGKKLGDHLDDILFKPLKMDCTFHPKTLENYIKPYVRTELGNLVLNMAGGPNLDPKVDMGGHGCFGTIESYLKFLRLWLNYGYSPDTEVRILKEETVKLAFQNHLPEGKSLLGIVPGLTDPDLFTLAGMAIAAGENPHLHPKGSIYWSGYGNLYYWVDLERKLAGIWATHIFPFNDIHSYTGGYFEVQKILNQVLKK